LSAEAAYNRQTLSLVSGARAQIDQARANKTADNALAQGIITTCKRFGLCGEGRVWSTVSLADTSQPFPASQAAKKSLAIVVIDAMIVSPVRFIERFF